MWEVIETPDGQQVHSCPVDDSRQHQLVANCPCHPRLEHYQKLLVLHNAFDFREDDEDISTVPRAGHS